jgi:hypothetical protein
MKRKKESRVVGIEGAPGKKPGETEMIDLVESMDAQAFLEIDPSDLGKDFSLFLESVEIPGEE